MPLTFDVNVCSVIDRKAARAAARKARAQRRKALKALSPVAECDRSMDAAAPGGKSFYLAIAAGVRYAFSRDLVGATAFSYALSVGRARGVLSGRAGYLDY